MNLEYHTISSTSFLLVMFLVELLVMFYLYIWDGRTLNDKDNDETFQSIT